MNEEFFKDPKFKEFLFAKHLHGVEVWYKSGEGKERRYLLQNWQLPEEITPETLIEFKPLTRRQRRELHKRLIKHIVGKK